MDRGFTLVESLVALVVVLLVAGGVASMLVPAEAGFQSQVAAADLQQRLRVAAEVLHHDLVQAGAGTSSGPRGGALAYCLPPIVPYRIGVMRPDPPGSFRSDTISIVYVPATAAQTIIASEVSPSGTSLDVVGLPGCPLGDAACGFSVGMLAAIHDESGAWELFRVGEVSGSTLVRDSGAFLNGYAAGARVAEVRVSVFYVEEDPSADGLVLRRYDGNLSDLPLVDQITRFEVEYFGEATPPHPRPASSDPLEPRVTYGPFAPVPTPSSGYPAGESCTLRLEAGTLVPRLPSLAGGAVLVPLGAGIFSDGPFCPGPSSPSRFDADLLRIRTVRVTIRAQAGAAALRGADGTSFARPGTARDAQWLVPDREIRIQVSPRNLLLGR